MKPHPFLTITKNLGLPFRLFLPLIGFWLITISANAESPPLMKRLITQGIEMPGKTIVTLLAPTLHNEQTSEQVESALKKLSGAAGWKRFSRKSAVAPVAIDLDYVKDAEGNRTGHQLHVAFVVHASLQTLRDKDLMQQMFGKRDAESEEVKGNEIADQRLQELGITKSNDTKFTKVEVPLIKKVLARGVIQVQHTSKEGRIEFAFQLDPRFNTPDQLANAWVHISKDNQDKATPPPDDAKWKAYSGAGGYLSVANVPGLEGACLIEARIAMHEPKEWFNGSSLLRSKLPLVIQESARSFRRKLK